MFSLSVLHSWHLLHVCYAEVAKDFSLPPPAIEQIIDTSEVSEKVVSPEKFDGENDIIDESNRNESALKKVETGSQTNVIDVEIQHQEKNSPG